MNVDVNQRKLGDRDFHLLENVFVRENLSTFISSSSATEVMSTLELNNPILDILHTPEEVRFRYKSNSGRFFIY